MGRRAQVSIFLVLGIAILLITGIAAFYIYSSKKPISEQPVDQAVISQVNNFVLSCLNQESKNALSLLGSQGRIYPAAFAATTSEKIAYFYYKGDGYFPSDISFHENDIARYVTENMPLCLNEFKDFPYEVTVQPKKVKISARFNVMDMSVSAIYPVNVKVGNSEATLSNFNTKINIKFNPIYDISKNIYQKTKEDPEWIDVDYLYEQNDYSIRLVQLDQSTLVYEIKDMKYGLDNNAWSYRFAMKFD
jgi:hypothetical protein